MASLMSWRKRIGEEDVETMLMATIETGQRSLSHPAASVHRAVAESTVMSMAAPHPIDSSLPGNAPVSVEVGGGQRSESSQRLQPWTSRIVIQIPSCETAEQFVGIGKSMLMPKTVTVSHKYQSVEVKRVWSLQSAQKRDSNQPHHQPAAQDVARSLSQNRLRKTQLQSSG